MIQEQDVSVSSDLSRTSVGAQRLPCEPAYGCMQYEEGRLASLRELGILDTGSEPEFDDLARLAALVCGTRTALFSLVDEERQWFKAKVGMQLDGTPRSESFCSVAIEQQELFIVEDAHADERFRDLPMVQSGEIRFYAGAPVCSPEGYRVGTLCVLDPKARQINGEQQEALWALARQAGAYLLIRKQVQQLVAAAEKRAVVERELRHNQGLLEEANRLLQQLATTDALTGLTNRRVLEDCLEQQGSLPGRTLSLLMVDVDHFKRVNDRLGHKMGDAVLRQIAEVLRAATRDTDTLCRYGGEEFVLLMPGLAHEAALLRAEGLRAAIAEDAQALTPITVSIGVATAISDHDGVPVQKLLGEADRALYTAKAEGRNCVRSAEKPWPAFDGLWGGESDVLQ